MQLQNCKQYITKMLNLPARTRKVPLFRGAGKEGNKKMLAGGVGFEPTLVCLTGRGLATRLLTHETHRTFKSYSDGKGVECHVPL